MIGCDDNSFNPWETSNYIYTVYLLSCLFNKVYNLTKYVTSSAAHLLRLASAPEQSEVLTRWQEPQLTQNPTQAEALLHVTRQPSMSVASENQKKLLLIIPKMAWRQTDNQLNGKLHDWFLPLVFSWLNFPNEPAVKCTFLPSHLCLSLCWGVMWRHSWWCLPPTWCCHMTCTCWSPGYPG